MAVKECTLFAGTEGKKQLKNVGKIYETCHAICYVYSNHAEVEDKFLYDAFG